MSEHDKGIAPHPVLGGYYNKAEDRRERVDQMFNSSAKDYDWICNMMSFGSGEFYRRDALLRNGVAEGMKVLDVGAGTGVVSYIAQELTGKDGLVVALDPSSGMLGEAKSLGVEHASMGLGEALPFADNTFDMLTMGFALRHVADLKTAFEEYLRVLKPGGKILLMEISRPDSKLATFFLKIYMKGIVPTLTRIFRGSKESEELMRYYWDTIEHCVRPAGILEALKESGGLEVKRHSLFGMFSEYTCIKVEEKAS